MTYHVLDSILIKFIFLSHRNKVLSSVIIELSGEGITNIEDYLGIEKYPDDI